MKTITLRMLVREPLKVKRMTRAGGAVQVTDSGVPLWILQPASDTEAQEAGRCRAIDEVLEETLRDPVAKISAGKLLDESRR